MKKWETPVIMVQEFEANEYVAACGDENRVYKFVCDAPAGIVYYYTQRDSTIDGYYTGTGSASRLGGYVPCKAKHEAPTSNVFFDGFVDYNQNRKCDSGEEAIIWVEKGYWGGINNWHATKQLDMTKWETAKS